jgi:hypothetical protein
VSKKMGASRTAELVSCDEQRGKDCFGSPGLDPVPPVTVCDDHGDLMMPPRDSFNQSHVSRTAVGTVMFIVLSNHWSPVIPLYKRNLVDDNQSGRW